MAYAILFFVGTVIGGVSATVIFMESWRKLKSEKLQADKDKQRIKDGLARIGSTEDELRRQQQEYQEQKLDFDQRVIAYDELLQENEVLKHDLQNIDVNVRKLELDHDLQARLQAELDERCQRVGKDYLKDSIAWIGKSLSTKNFVKLKEQLLKKIKQCRDIGFDVSESDEEQYQADLKTRFELAVRAEYEREEQARIKAQIREEQKLEREIERETKQLEREREAIGAALERAIAEAKDQYSDEVERLKARLAEAEEKTQRAISRAQMTKAGHVYVISNIGSFGEGVFKIGMTRRLEPEDRVRELSSASVPFPYDVHMMISSDNAPELENTLHKALHAERVNKVNPRKEFFQTSIDDIKSIVEDTHGEIVHVADAEALEYRQSLDMTDEDAEYIERVYETIGDEDDDTYEDI